MDGWNFCFFYSAAILHINVVIAQREEGRARASTVKKERESESRRERDDSRN